MSKYAKLAGYLADFSLSTGPEKTADDREPTLWDRFRPENPTRPGANWMTGLGTGATAAGAELGLGRYGLTDSVQRLLERSALRRDPFGSRLHRDEFRRTLADDESTRFLNDLFRDRETSVGGRDRVGRLLSRNYGEQDLANPGHIRRVRDGLHGLIDPNDREMMRRWTNLTATHSPSNATTGERVKKTLDRMIAWEHPKVRLSDHERNLLTKFRTGLGGTETAEQAEQLQSGLRNLARSVKGGNKGSPVQAVFSPRAQRLLDRLAASPIERNMTEDASKVNRLVKSFGQFTKGRPVPSAWRRLGRVRNAAGAAGLLGAYALPSAVDFTKWLTRGKSTNGHAEIH